MCKKTKTKRKALNIEAMKTRVFLTTLMIVLMTGFTSLESNARVRNSTMISFLEDATEEEFTLEPWMVNDHYWMCVENNCLARDWDKAPELESWMTDGVRWDVHELMSTEKDENLHLEPWMSGDSGMWSRNTGINQGKDQPLVLEEWMTSDASWVQK